LEYDTYDNLIFEGEYFNGEKMEKDMNMYMMKNKKLI